MQQQLISICTLYIQAGELVELGSYIPTEGLVEAENIRKFNENSDVASERDAIYNKLAARERTRYDRKLAFLRDSNGDNDDDKIFLRLISIDHYRIHSFQLYIYLFTYFTIMCAIVQ